MPYKDPEEQAIAQKRYRTRQREKSEQLQAEVEGLRVKVEWYRPLSEIEMLLEECAKLRVQTGLDDSFQFKFIVNLESKTDIAALIRKIASTFHPDFYLNVKSEKDCMPNISMPKIEKPSEVRLDRLARDLAKETNKSFEVYRKALLELVKLSPTELEREKDLLELFAYRQRKMQIEHEKVKAEKLIRDNRASFHYEKPASKVHYDTEWEKPKPEDLPESFREEMDTYDLNIKIGFEWRAMMEFLKKQGFSYPVAHEVAGRIAVFEAYPQNEVRWFNRHLFLKRDGKIWTYKLLSPPFTNGIENTEFMGKEEWIHSEDSRKTETFLCERDVIEQKVKKLQKHLNYGLKSNFKSDEMFNMLKDRKPDIFTLFEAMLRFNRLKAKKVKQTHEIKRDLSKVKITIKGLDNKKTVPKLTDEQIRERLKKINKWLDQGKRVKAIMELLDIPYDSPEWLHWYDEVRGAKRAREQKEEYSEPSINATALDRIIIQGLEAGLTDEEIWTGVLHTEPDIGIKKTMRANILNRIKILRKDVVKRLKIQTERIRHGLDDLIQMHILNGLSDEEVWQRLISNPQLNLSSQVKTVVMGTIALIRKKLQNPLQKYPKDSDRIKLAKGEKKNWRIKIKGE